MKVRTRMAPSPTGDYHIGHIRTLLYNFAFTRKNDGKFILRIEDTDRNRYVEGAVDRIKAVITDYGFSWDEGPDVGGDKAPYVQSERLPLYKEYAEKLIQSGHAYRCFCTKERLSEVREKQQEQGVAATKYDKHCLNLSEEEVSEKLSAGVPYVIRLNVPKDRDITFEDSTYGKVTINTNDIDDQVLLKSDGFPTYHLAVVVDDHLMEITHIMRGMDWLPSTPKHVLLYEAFGWELPIYIHLPNLKEIGGTKKLSKRFGSVYAIEFLKEGYLPEAVVNALMFLGWNPGTEKEIYSLDEFIQDFTLERIQKADLVSFDRNKLLWFNGQYIRDMSSEVLYERLLGWAKKFDIELLGLDSPREKNISVLELIKTRMRVLSDYNDLCSYFYTSPEVDKAILNKYSSSVSRTQEILRSFYNDLSPIPESSWNPADLEVICSQILSKYDFSPKEAYMTLRVALTGRKASPHIFDVLAVLEKEESLLRLKKVLSS